MQVLKIPQFDSMYPSWTCPRGIQSFSDGVMAILLSKSFSLWKIEGLQAVLRVFCPLGKNCCIFSAGGTCTTSIQKTHVTILKVLVLNLRLLTYFISRNQSCPTRVHMFFFQKCDLIAAGKFQMIIQHMVFIVSFLPKILGRNQDFAIGSAWGGELYFKNAWGELGFGEE